MKWPTVSLPAVGGQPAIAPLVISASRATDIPAFHAEWLMNRLHAGYCAWENPFNAKTRQYVAFTNCKIIVFWSKNPAPLLPYLPILEDMGIKFYFQFTLNDYAREGLEPNLPPLETRMETFQILAERYGRHRVIWRYDPIILGGGLTVEETLDRIHAIATTISSHTEKLVFSFVDWYAKTRRELGKVDASLRPPRTEEMEDIAAGLGQINDSLATPLNLATCAELASLEHWGIAHNKCIDPALLVRLCPSDPDIARWYAMPQTQHSLLPLTGAVQKPQKDTGQRKPCGCAPSKDIGAYNTCRHFCAYCYANQSRSAVTQRLRNTSTTGETL